MTSNREAVRWRTKSPRRHASTSRPDRVRLRRTSPLFAIAVTTLGCSVHPGLANAPALGTVPPSGGHEHDAVANGRDSCERFGGGSPLRPHLPPCEGDGFSQPILRVGAVPEPRPATDFEFMYLRWVRCSRLDDFEDGYALKDSVAVRELFPHTTWSNRCADWMH
ncbi:MAG TPA: hypothetical protein VEK07_10210 [Polyangiaceae bacterium]|nr:hypothetical protein [Polyangiaceae bacterium]